jgi:uncharacterized MAPEG superfamily protein
MTIAFWTLLAAIVLPWIMAAIKKSRVAQRGEYNNAAPRTIDPKLEGLYKRAQWAEKNSFEILPGYVAAVIVAHLAGAEQDCIDILALVFIASRVLYCVCYLKNWALLRSAIWFVGLLCIVGLFVISA